MTGDTVIYNDFDVRRIGDEGGTRKGTYRGRVGVGRRATAGPSAALLGDHLPPSGGSVLRRVEGAAEGGGDGRLQLARPGHGSGNDCRLASGGNGKGRDDDGGGEYEKYR